MIDNQELQQQPNGMSTTASDASEKALDCSQKNIPSNNAQQIINDVACRSIAEWNQTATTENQSFIADDKPKKRVVRKKSDTEPKAKRLTTHRIRRSNEITKPIQNQLFHYAPNGSSIQLVPINAPQYHLMTPQHLSQYQQQIRANQLIRTEHPVTSESLPAAVNQLNQINSKAKTNETEAPRISGRSGRFISISANDDNDIKSNRIQKQTNQLEMRTLKTDNTVTHLIDGYVIKESDKPFTTIQYVKPIEKIAEPKIESNKKSETKRNRLTQQKSIKTKQSDIELPAKRSRKNSTESNPDLWTIDDVSNFVLEKTCSEELAEKFRTHEVDGSALLLIKEEFLMQFMNMKLGPALKLCNHIAELRLLNKTSP